MFNKMQSLNILFYLRAPSLSVPVLCFVFGLLMVQGNETCRRNFQF